MLGELIDLEAIAMDKKNIFIKNFQLLHDLSEENMGSETA
jgi:CRP/FNR family transcriptional regulator